MRSGFGLRGGPWVLVMRAYLDLKVCILASEMVRGHRILVFEVSENSVRHQVA